MARRSNGRQDHHQEDSANSGHGLPERTPIAPPCIHKRTQRHADGHDHGDQKQRPCHADNGCQRAVGLPHGDCRQGNSPEGNAPADELGQGERADKADPSAPTGRNQRSGKAEEGCVEKPG